MFDLIETDRGGVLTFGEFVDITSTFAPFEPSELLNFFFFVLDQDKVGEVDIKKVEHFIYLMWDHVIISNLTEGVEFMKTLDSGDGRVKYRDLQKVERRYPSVFYPAQRLCMHVQKFSLGEGWWTLKKIEIKEAADAKKRMEALKKNKQRADMQAEQDKLNEEMLKKKMGMNYYLRFWERDKARAQIKKIEQINKNLEEMEAKILEEEKKKKKKK